MTRTVYYTTYVSHYEFQNGALPHFSKPFKTLEEARAFEKSLGDINTQIEMHYEIWDRNEWRLDDEMREPIKPIIED